MSKKKQAVNSDLTGDRSLTLPLAVAGKSDREVADEIGGARHMDPGCRNRDARLTEKLKEVKASSRRVQLTALSKVVNRAFTGWTIKTQS